MFTLLDSGLVELIHDEVLNDGELEGRAGDKSLEDFLSRVERRLDYGLIADVFGLAGCYAEAIAQGHCFNDGNKRTTFRTMYASLVLNGIVISFDSIDVADRIMLLAQGKLDAEDFAQWLRSLSQ